MVSSPNLGNHAVSIFHSPLFCRYLGLKKGSTVELVTYYRNLKFQNNSSICMCFNVDFSVLKNAWVFRW